MRIGQIGDGRVPGPIRGSVVRRAAQSQEVRGRNLCFNDKYKKARKRREDRKGDKRITIFKAGRKRQYTL